MGTTSWRRCATPPRPNRCSMLRRRRGSRSRWSSSTSRRAHRSIARSTPIVESTGSLDIVVNNAGIELFGAVHLVSDDEATRQLDTNVLGIVRVARAVVPHMVRQGRGVIVNVGSVAGKVGVPYSGLYAASKHAVEAITEAMHFELAHLGIRVAVVEPGQFATGLSGNSVVAASMPEDSSEYVRWQSFRGRMRQLVGGEPADARLVAEVIYEAATSTEPRLRWPVGDDATLGARHQGGDVVRGLRIGDAHHARLARVAQSPPRRASQDRSGLLKFATAERSGSPERVGDRRVVVSAVRRGPGPAPSSTAAGSSPVRGRSGQRRSG